VPTDAPSDIYNTRSWLKDALLQPQSREAFQKLLQQGWVDSIARKHPGEPMYTFWDYFRNRWQRNAGLRIDHLLLNPPAARRLKAAGVDREMRGLEKASDHAPAWLMLSP
jgi:exodeoxyribonuclease III